jgi:hypothetical protein
VAQQFYARDSSGYPFACLTYVFFSPTTISTVGGAIAAAVEKSVLQNIAIKSSG